MADPGLGRDGHGRGAVDRAHAVAGWGSFGVSYPSARWRPTPAHLRAVVGGLVVMLTAVLARRPDLLVLAAPLACAAVWAIVLRPTRVPVLRQWIGQGVLREGEARTWHVDVVDHDGRVDDVGAALDPVRWTELRPAEGHVAASVRDDGDGPLDVVVRATRWGRRSVGPARVVASSAWAAYRYEPGGSTDARTIVVLAQPARFDAPGTGGALPGQVGRLPARPRRAEAPSSPATARSSPATACVASLAAVGADRRAPCHVDVGGP